MKQENPLIEAILSNDIQKLKKSLKLISVNSYQDGKSALMLAIENSNLDAISVLLNDESLKINSQNSKGMSALHFAVEKQDPIMVALLLLKNADYYIFNTEKKIPFDYLKQDNSLENKLIKEFFYQSGFRKNGIHEEAKEYYKKYKKITQTNNEVFMKNAFDMLNLYQNNRVQYFDKRTISIDKTIIKFIKTEHSECYIEKILNYLKPNLNFFEQGEHILLHLMNNSNYDILNIIKQTHFKFDLSIVNENRENIMHNICETSNMLNKILEKPHVKSYLINHIKKYNLLEKESNANLIPFFYLKHYSSKSLFNFVAEVITQEKIFDINKKYNNNGKTQSFLEFLSEKSSHDNANMTYLYEILKSFNEKNILETSINSKSIINKKVKI